MTAIQEPEIRPGSINAAAARRRQAATIEIVNTSVFAALT
jgi:hypothetical protein